MTKYFTNLMLLLHDYFSFHTHKARLEIAHLLQDATEEMARSVQKASEGGGELHGSAGDLIEIVDRVRSGEPMTTDSVIQLSRLFSDEITLDNISRELLIFCIIMFTYD